MLLYRPAYRHAEHAAKPTNLAEAQAIAPGLTPVYPDPHEFLVDVETPSGEMLAIDDPLLIDKLRDGIRDRHELTLCRSDRAMTDCRPISLVGIQTARQLSSELGTEIDRKRFRANIYVDLGSSDGFGENEFVGRTLRIGEKAVIAVIELDPRCKMITLDPITGQANPDIMRRVSREHNGNVGVYAAVLVEGTIRPGDDIALLNQKV